MANGKAKGGAYEREICRDLSLWFSRGARDDLFWRSAGSGSRATVRSKQGKSTKGHAGDISPTCHEGEPLTNLVAIEVKRGYAKATFMDLLDCAERAKMQTFEEWICQAVHSQESSGAYSWLLITRRNSRQALATFPFTLYRRLRGEGCAFEKKAILSVNCCCGGKRQSIRFVTVQFDDFLINVSPTVVRKLDLWWARCKAM